MAYSVTFKPEPFGKLQPTPGTPIRATANLANSTDGLKAFGNTSVRDDLWVNKIEFKADQANTGKVYIGKSGMNTTTLAGVIRVIDPGESWSVEDVMRGNNYHLGEWLVDLSVGTDFCHGSADVI
jgi:hypothetical protein